MNVKVLKKYKIQILIFALLIGSYFFLRLIQILNVPMFTDEAIYTRWTQIAKQDSAERFISLTDGKQPLFVWINIIFMYVIHEPLLSGRLVSTFAGLFTMIGLFFLGKELFKKQWIGFFSMFLYCVYPFALVYDRLAIYDSLVGTFYVWSLYFAVLLIKKIRFNFAIILGVVLGGAALNKSIGLYSMYLLPTNILLFNLKAKSRWRLLATWIIFLGIAGVIAEGMYAILRFSPWFYIVKQKDGTFFYSFSDLFHNTLSFWMNNFSGNIHGLLSWLIPYITWPAIAVLIFAFLFYKEFWREKLLLFLYFIIPFTGFALIAKVMYPRYIFFMTLPLLPIISYSFFKIFQKLKNIYLFIVITGVLLSLMLYADYAIFTNFATSPVPDSDRNQLVNEWPAGGGLKESVQFFTEEAKHKKIYIGTEGTFGLLPFGLEIYLLSNPNITIHGFWPIENTPPKEALTASQHMPTYFIFYQPCPSCAFSGDAPKSWPVHLIKRYTKGIGKTFYTIYQINP